MSKKGRLGSLLVGLGIGAGLGILFAPKKGSETREDIKNKFNEIMQKIKEIDVNEVKEDLTEKIENIKKELEDLDKEKVLKIAKQKSEEINKELEKLYNDVKVKASEKASLVVDDLRKYAIKTTKNILKKLEEQEKDKNK